jgi:hypothetical protein
MARIGLALVTLLTILSAIACAAACGLWVRSQFRRDLIQHGNDSMAAVPGESDEAVEARRPPWSSGLWWDDWTACTDRRGLVFIHEWADTHAAAGSGQFGLDIRGWAYRTDEADDESSIRLWPTYQRDGSLAAPDPWGHWEATVPFWMPAVLFGALPTASAVRFRRHRFRRRAGRCGRCGYDLRATPDRCPECGAVVDAPPVQLYGATSPSPGEI